MKEIFIYLIGLESGSFLTVILMCCLQINRINNIKLFKEEDFTKDESEKHKKTVLDK